MLADIFGLSAHVWFYPHYQGLWLFWIWLILYPFGSLAVLELLYFLAGKLDAPLYFEEHPTAKWHNVFDIFENVLFLLIVATLVLGAIDTKWGLALPYLTGLSVLWMCFALVKLRFHIKHSGHYLLIALVTTGLVTLSHGLPGVLSSEWIYLETDFLDFLLIGIPSWIWIGWFLFILITLRLWIFLVPHKK